MHISELYEPLISREIDSFVARAHEFRRAHSSRELFDAVVRFAVLSYSPSQHGKHALMASLAAYDLTRVLGTRFDDLLIECAIYAAQSRLPWSEPPITDPPTVAHDDPFTLEEIRAAVGKGDRLRAERWLARRMEEPDLERDFFAMAAEDLADFGHKLIVSVASWRIAELYPEKARFGILRNAVVEWTAYREEHNAPSRSPGGAAPLLDRIIQRIDADRGAIESFHLLALFEAGVAVTMITGEASVEERVHQVLAEACADASSSSEPRSETSDLPIYRLARDCAEYLKAWAIRERLVGRFPTADLDRVVSAARYNLEEGPSMEEWSFA